MSNLQIKNVPEDLHAELRRRADARGMTLRDYVLDLLRRDVARPDMQEWLDRVASRPRVTLGESVVDIIHEERRLREEHPHRGGRDAAVLRRGATEITAPEFHRWNSRSRLGTFEIGVPEIGDRKHGSPDGHGRGRGLR